MKEMGDDPYRQLGERSLVGIENLVCAGRATGTVCQGEVGKEEWELR